MKVLDNTEDSELEICVKKDNEKLEKGLNCNMKCEKINELSFHTSFFYEKNQ